MKYATRMLALAMTMLPLLATAQLASNEKIMAKVPFEFVLGNKVVPSGEWIVQTVSMNGSILQIRNKDAGVQMMFIPLPVEGKKAAGHYTLVFHKYGNSYFLAQVTIAGTRNSYELPQSRAEKELRAQNVPAISEILLASRQ